MRSSSALVLIAMLVASACASDRSAVSIGEGTDGSVIDSELGAFDEAEINDGPETAEPSMPTTSADDPPATSTEPAPDPPALDEGVTLIRSRLLGEDIAVGEPWTVAVITPGELAAALPEVALDAESEVLFRFTLAESGSAALTERCAQGWFEGLAFRESDRRLFPVTTPGDQRGPDDGDVECDDDANPHSIFVAVAREDLPAGDFEVWLSGNEPPQGVVRNVVQIPAGQLRAPDPLASDVAVFVPGETLAPLDVRNVYRVSTHCGLSRLFEVNGTQWLIADEYSNSGDRVPAPWTDDVRGEEIDLQIEFVDENRLRVSSLGSDVRIEYNRAPDREDCG